MIDHNDIDRVRISLLKLAAMLLVVLVHAGNIFHYADAAAGGGAFVVAPLSVMSKAGNPIFAIVSAFLLFHKNRPFAENCRRKMHSLVIPYLIWIMVYIAFESVGKSFLPSFFGKLPQTATKWFNFTFGAPFVGWPDAYPPLWFIRDLIILNLLYPFFRFMIDRVPAVCCVFAIVMWFVPILGNHLIAGFIVGGLLAVYPNLMDRFSRMVSLKTSCICFLLGALLTWCFYENRISYMIATLLDMIAIFGICTVFKDRLYESKCCRQLSGYTFAIYVLHGKILSVMQIAATKLLPNDDWILAIGYFLFPVVTIIVCCMIAWAFKKLFPQLYYISTGGR